MTPFQEDEEEKRVYQRQNKHDMKRRTRNGNSGSRLVLDHGIWHGVEGSRERAANLSFAMNVTSETKQMYWLFSLCSSKLNYSSHIDYAERKESVCDCENKTWAAHIRTHCSEALKYNDKCDLYIGGHHGRQMLWCVHAFTPYGGVCACVCFYAKWAKMKEKKRLRQIKRSHAINLNIKLV